ncbi:MAG: glycoside hydrolase family 57 protein [Halioglobus sp.]|nr:glycoside hydrolase family 57 protein [Halioglobus sp.]
MQSEGPMSVVLLWHMHQPEYRDLRSGVTHLPWTYLHAIKDYVDMAAHLEAQPAARVVVNFTPILLEQIEDYIAQVDSFLNGHGTIRDPVLSQLAEPALPSSEEDRLRLVQYCLRANRERMIDRFAPYQRLASMAEWYEAHPRSLIYASNQFIADILMWYHIAWMAESVRRNDPRIARFIDKEVNFTLHDRRELLEILLEQLRSIVPRYRELAQQERVELCMSPYAHPIVPLLIDMECARDAMPQAHLPVAEDYPGGRERALWHLDHGLAVFERVFGRQPAGIWPSEGGVSQEALQLFAERGFRWAASGGSVLHNSHDNDDDDCTHRVYRFGDADIDCIFRDDGLSDLIGFTYSDWHAEHAVANLVGHMENIAELCPDRERCLITIILDGENAWEYYPENGFHFITELYAKLAENPLLRMSTLSEFLERGSPEPLHEERLVAGSWVYGTFSTWIGDPDKNRAWDLLVEAKRCFDEQVARGNLAPDELAAAEQQLAICEGSDWFWWFGDYNPSATVGQFDYLYRLHLANLYQLLKLEAPTNLSEVISRGGGAPSRGGVMRHHSESGGAS